MKKGKRIIVNRIAWVGVILVLSEWACSKKAAVPTKQLELSTQAVKDGFQEVQVSKRSLYCSQIRNMRKLQHKSDE